MRPVYWLSVVGQLMLLWVVIAAWVVCIVPLSLVAGAFEERKKR